MRVDVLASAIAENILSWPRSHAPLPPRTARIEKTVCPCGPWVHLVARAVAPLEGGVYEGVSAGAVLSVVLTDIGDT